LLHLVVDGTVASSPTPSVDPFTAAAAAAAAAADPSHQLYVVVL